MAKLAILLLSFFLALTPMLVTADEVVDINTASAAELARVLVGVGRAKADAIIEHREKFGPFANIDELRYVSGIGAATVERNREKMTVGAGGQTASVADR